MRYFVFGIGGVCLLSGCLLSGGQSSSQRLQSPPVVENRVETPGPDSLGALPNGKWVTAHLAVGGQPSKMDLLSLKDAGVGLVINLRRPSEMTFDEEAYLAELGIRYAQFPIGGVNDFYQELPAQSDLGLESGRVLEQVAALLKRFTSQTIEDRTHGGQERVLVHCASGNRVGAVFALMAYELDQVGVDAALEIGGNHGLTGLAGAVREALFAQEQPKE